MKKNMDPGLIKGTRWVLIGAIWYLLEWVFIIAFGSTPPPTTATTADMAAYFAANATKLPIYAAGISAAVMGRIVLFVELRNAMREYEEARPLLDFAVAIAVVAVATEIVSMGFDWMAVTIATYGPEPPVVVASALRNAGFDFTNLVIVPYGLSIAVAGYAMLRTQALPAWISWFGLIGGILYILTVDLGPAVNRPEALFNALVPIIWLLTVIWMIATGIVLFHRARPIVQSSPAGANPVL